MERTRLNKAGKNKDISSRLQTLNPAIVVLIKTRVKKKIAQVIRHKLKLRGNYLDNCDKHENGIFGVFWDDNRMKIEPIKSMYQMIHCKVYDTTGRFMKWMTLIYALNQLEMRKNMWQNIEELHSQQHGPWMLIGDFNNVVKVEEKIGGSMVSEKKYNDLNYMMNKTELYEMESKGDYFSWSNKQGENAIHSRIDRILGNTVWMQKHVNVVLTNMSPNVFDHSILILNEQLQSPVRTYNFKFTNSAADLDNF